ncbi:MAG: hypothetical protein ACQETH_05825 [Candidatus Rifleibacteriota bacterium]
MQTKTLQMKYERYILILFFFLFLSFCANAEEKPEPDICRIYFQDLGEVGFSKIESKRDILLADGIYMSEPRLKSPLATDTALNISSHTVTLFPGAVIKKAENNLMVLSGRIMVESVDKNLKPIIFRGKRYLCHYNYGKLLIETTPLKNTWFLMKNNGSAWIKTFSRKIIDLQAGTEVEVPLFGAVNVDERPGSRWNFAPENAVVKDVKAVFSPNPEPEQINGSSSEEIEPEEEIATTTQLATDTNSEIK